MARKVDEAANFVFVQLIEQEPDIYVNISLMVVVFSSHAVSTGFSYRHIMTGSVSSIAEGKCTKLKNTIMHYVNHTHLR
jgi:hypothetical protein